MNKPVLLAWASLPTMAMFVTSAGHARPAPATIEQGKLEILEHCWFKAGSATVPRSCDDLLDAVAAVFKNRPEIELVSIEGHSALIGDGKGTMDVWNLSMNRARLVRDALVKRGVESHRLTIVAFGSDRPMDTNQTKYGQDKNRRVEFKLLRILK
jgi:outer membrane protein OmpA-like peptidoglycan-associated protein